METYLDCIPCFLKQALEAARMAGADEKTQKTILDEISRAIPDIKLSSTPPEMGKTIHNLVKKITGKEDPYKEIKDKANKQALKLYPDLKAKVESAQDRLRMATELAIAGNIIDYGTKNSLDVDDELEKILRKEQEAIKHEKETLFNFRDFKESARKAKIIMYIADNVGETVFDLLLIEELKRNDPEKKIIYAVRERPIINDALKEDAHTSGIDKVAEVISSGSDIPGTIKEECSEDFRKNLEKSDIVISKGQGNFESFTDANKHVYYLFMAKCPIVAKDVGCKVGDIILLKKGD
jgi:uncharacterized protein with ATP-grasp and redox domains